MKTRSVLSGGGAKGAYQMDALEVLDDHSYTYDTIAEVSVGSLNGLANHSSGSNISQAIARGNSRRYLLHWLGLIRR